MSKNLLHDTGSERLKKRIANRAKMQNRAHPTPEPEERATRRSSEEIAADASLDQLAHSARAEDHSEALVPGPDESLRKRNRQAARALHTGSVAPTPAPVRRPKPPRPQTQTPERQQPATPEEIAAKAQARKERRLERLQGIADILGPMLKEKM